MNVLSLFDGMSCGQIALQRAGIKVDNYYASEINQYAIKATMHNYPDTIQLGDVTKIDLSKLPKIDLLIGGSPCQGFSNAGTGLNFEHPESKLFFEFVKIKNYLTEKNPQLIFLLENVKMRKDWELLISKYMNINPVEINSALVSAQNRRRLYWTNINLEMRGLFNDIYSHIEKPQNKNLTIKDILENNVNEKYFLSQDMINWLNKHSVKHNQKINIKNVNEKSQSINVVDSKMNLQTNYIIINTQPRSGDPKKGGHGLLSRNDNKTYCVDTTNAQAVQIFNTQNYLQYDASGKGYKSQHNRIHYDNVKAPTVAKNPGRTKTFVNTGIRRLTPIEVCRLQTVPDNYFYDNNGKQIISNTRIYECLGNGWTVDVIAHIFGYLKNKIKKAA